MTVTYSELVDDRSPGAFGFNLEGGSASLTYIVDYASLNDTLVDIIGSVEANGQGGLKRKNPKAHPQFPWMFAERISNGQGVKFVEAHDAETGYEAPTIEQYAEYSKYFIRVEFTPRPYAVLEDSSISDQIPISYVDPYTLSTVNTYYINEWFRYVDWSYEPSLDIVTAQQGMMVLRGNTGTAPDKYPFQGFPTIRLPKVAFRMKWFFVPFSFVYSDDSAIRNFLGTVNQFDWYGFDAGTLLYAGAMIERFTPPFPRRVNSPSQGVTFSTEKLCHIEFLFEHVIRPMATGVTPTTPASTNYIPAGHNLVPWFGNRQFYYCTAWDGVGDTTNSSRVPIYLSTPFELLFTDPDAP